MSAGVGLYLKNARGLTVLSGLFLVNFTIAVFLVIGGPNLAKLLTEFGYADNIILVALSGFVWFGLVCGYSKN